MYEVKAINASEEIYLNIVSTSPDAPRITGTIKQGINVIDSFTFTIYPNHPAYNSLHPFSTKITVFNTKTRKYEFVGRILMTNQTWAISMTQSPSMASITTRACANICKSSSTTTTIRLARISSSRSASLKSKKIYIAT